MSRDIHGCSTSLAALIRAIQLGPNDTVVNLGDVIDRGPDTPGVIEQLLGRVERGRLNEQGTVRTGC